MVLALAPSVAQQAAPEVSRERLRADLDFLASPPLEEPRLLSIAIALDEDVRFFTRKPPIVEGT